MDKDIKSQNDYLGQVVSFILNLDFLKAYLNLS